MAMRSQVYAWDLYKGTAVTGQPLTTSIQSNTLSPIKAIASYAAGSSPVGNYLVDEEYFFATLTPSSGGTGGTIIPTIVSGSGAYIDAGTLTQRGHYYELNDILGVMGEILTPNGNLFQYEVTEIYPLGFGYATGITPTTTITGSGSGLTINITAVTGVGEIISYTIQASGNGYAIGDTVTIDGGTSSPRVGLTIETINYTSGKRYIDLGKSFSIFTEKGNTLKTKPKTKESQFIVVEAFGCSPTAFFPGDDNGAGNWPQGDYRGSPIKNSLGGPRAYLQFYINTTGYFKDSDGVPRDGIPGNSAPYPLTTQFSVCSERKQSPVYILPLQTWDLFMICYNDNLGDGNQTQILSTQQGQLQAFFKYTLYDGVDCIIALRLLESSISITPENVDMFKRNLYQNNITLPNDALEETTKE
jgi:hypothetical protein